MRTTSIYFRVIRFISHIPPEIRLLLIALLAFYQIAFLQNSLKWEVLRTDLPQRYFIAEALQNGSMPLWNPYMPGGQDVLAHTPSAWSPEVVLPAFISGYTNLTLHLFFILHVFVAGLGMFYLHRRISGHNTAAFITGTAYMLSGIFVGHAQHMDILTGAAWLPWVLLWYLRLYQNPRFMPFLALFLFLFLMLTGGHPSLSVLLLAMMIVMGIIGTFRHWRKRADFKRWMLWNVVLAIVIGAWALFEWKVLQEGTGLAAGAAEGVKDNPLAGKWSFMALLSFLFPFGAAGNADFWGTSLGMANSFMGLFMLVFLLYGILRLRKPLPLAFLSGGIFALIAAMYAPASGVLGLFVPGAFRIAGLFMLIFFAGFALQHWYERTQKERLLPGIVLVVTVLLVVLVVVGASYISAGSYSAANLRASAIGRMALQGVLQVLLLTTFLVLGLIKKNKKALLAPLLVIEMALAVQLNIQATAISGHDPVHLYRQICGQPQGFPLPAPGKLEKHQASALHMGQVTEHVHVFRKIIPPPEAPLAPISAGKYPLVYLSGTPVTAANAPPADYKQKVVVLSAPDYKQLKNQQLKHTGADSLKIKAFAPNRLDVTSQTANPQLITLMQQNARGWKVRIDGERVPHYTANGKFMSVLLPAGRHEVTFRYHRPGGVVALLMAYALFAAALLAWLVALVYRQSRWPRMVTLGITGLFILTLVDGFSQPHYEKIRRLNYRNMERQLNNWQYQYALEKLPVVATVDNLPAFRRINPFAPAQTHSGRFYLQEDIPPMLEKLRSFRSGYMVYVRSNVFARPELESAIKHYYPETVEQVEMPHAFLEIRKKGLYDISQTVRN